MRKLIATLVVLALIVVGADVAGRLIVQQKASQELATQLNTHTTTTTSPRQTSGAAGADPSVRIHGFSFLVQAIRGEYSHITIDVPDLTLGPIGGTSVHADLYDVHFPLSDAFSGTLDHLTADRATMRAVIPGSALASAFQQPGLSISAAGDGIVQVHTAMSVAGQTFPVTADVAISVTDSMLRLAARPVSAAGVTIPPAVGAALQDRLSTSLSLAALPFPLRSATASVSDGNLVITATAAHLKADELRPSG